MDVISVGEMLIDFTPGKEANSYVRNPGGAPANAVIAIARNGLSTGFAGKLGDDDFGRFLKETLEKEGVKVLCPELTKEAITTLAFVTLYENGERSFTFARKPGADMLLTKDDIDENEIRQARMVHAGSVNMTKEPARGANLYAMKTAHDNGRLVSFDVNYRDTLWESEAACKEVADQVYDYVDFLKISEEELYFVGGEENIPNFMKEHGISVVIETLGADGAKYFFNGHSEHVPGHKVHAVDATGAGDAFWGGFLSSLIIQGVTNASDITEEILKKAMEYGNYSGALCVQKKGAISSLPTRAEIEELIRSNAL